MKTDIIGNIEWSKVYQAPYRDDVHDILLTPDGGYIVTGVTKGLVDTIKQEYFLMKTTRFGSVEWVTGTSNNNFFVERCALAAAEDGGWMVAGSKRGLTKDGGSRIFVIKTDTAGKTGCNWNINFDVRNALFEKYPVYRDRNELEGYRPYKLRSQAAALSFETCECNDYDKIAFDYEIDDKKVTFYNVSLDGEEYFWILEMTAKRS